MAINFRHYYDYIGSGNHRFDHVVTCAYSTACGKRYVQIAGIFFDNLPVEFECIRTSNEDEIC